MCLASSVGILRQLQMDSLGVRVNQRPVHVARQLAGAQDRCGDFSHCCCCCCRGRGEAKSIWLPLRRYQRCLAFNLPARTQTGCLSMPVRRGEKKKRHVFVLAEWRPPSVDSRDDEPPKGESVGVVFATARAHQADTKAFGYTRILMFGAETCPV